MSVGTKQTKKVSVITPTYNASKMLKRTLESVLRQNYPQIEHVVADGGSTDDSVKILREYEVKFEQAGKKLIWISEKDYGVFDGVNKASNMASGDLLIFMPDVFADSHVVSEMVDKLENSGLDYIFGGLIYQQNGKVIRRWTGKPGSWKFGFMMATPTLLYTRSIWEKYGPYSGNYVSKTGQDASDYDFQIKLMMDKQLKYSAIQKPLVIYYAGGSSNNNFRYRWASIKECQKILKDNHVPLPLFINLCKTGRALFAYLGASRKKIELEDWMI